ncbi:MAG: ABC transporter ATP-binding protein [Desulfomonile sp.]|nr:ABC transporter ATP-binding protein [Desulfomonile sp.]
MTAPLLEVRDLSKAFGNVVTANNLNLSLTAGVLTSIIGPNGAGKSTLINILTGFIPPDSGRIIFQSQDITYEPIYRRVRLGLCRSFQVVNVFTGLTLFENISIPILAAHRRANGLFSTVSGEKAVREEAHRILQRIGLQEQGDLPASALSHGDQRVLEVGIALAARPKLLFLDEPTAGMNPVERIKILENIRQLSQEGEVTFVIVEHDMDIVFSLSERVIVLHRGDVIGDGPPEQIKADPHVREVYLGEEVVA